MKGPERRTVLAIRLATGLILGVSAVVWQSTGASGNNGYFAYEPLSGAVYPQHVFAGTSYDTETAADYARLRTFLGMGLLGAAAGLALGLVAVLRARGVPRSRRRFGLAALSGAIVGMIGAATLHYVATGPLYLRSVNAAAAEADAANLGRHAHPAWWPSVVVVPLVGALCGLALGLLAGNEKRSIATTE